MVPSEKKELKSHPVLLSPPSRLLVLWRNAARAPSARVSASAPPYLCVWSRLSHCLVYFHHRMAVLDFYQGNRFSQGRFRMGHSSKKGRTNYTALSRIRLCLFRGRDRVAGWATS